MTFPLLRLAAGISGRIIGTAASIFLETISPPPRESMWDEASFRAGVLGELGVMAGLLQDVRNAVRGKDASRPCVSSEPECTCTDEGPEHEPECAVRLARHTHRKPWEFESTVSAMHAWNEASNLGPYTMPPEVYDDDPIADCHVPNPDDFESSESPCGCELPDGSVHPAWRILAEHAQADRAALRGALDGILEIVGDTYVALTPKASAAPVNSPTDAAPEERPAPEPPPATGAGQLFPFINHDKENR